MSTKSALEFLDDLPGVNDDLHYYAPIAVFGYVGYTNGFNLDLVLLPQEFTEQELITLLPLELIVLTLFFASFTSTIMNKSRTMLEILNRSNSNRAIYEGMAYISFWLGLCLVMIHIESIYIVYQQRIYATGIIGLIIGFYQALIVFGALSIVATKILEETLSSIHSMFS